MNSPASPKAKIKTIVYIDGFNLYYGLKRTPYKWLDLKKMVYSVLENHHHIIEIKYFTARVKSSRKDSSRPERQATYWRALESISELTIIEGRLKKRNIKGKFLGPIGRGFEKGEIVEIEKYEEKESDVNIASHILLDCAQRKMDCIVLISNDTDLKTPLAFARRMFHQKIGIVSPKKYTHQDLKVICHFNINITDKTLRNSQFPKIVGRVKKPKTW